jgi:hypothetical protein
MMECGAYYISRPSPFPPEIGNQSGTFLLLSSVIRRVGGRPFFPLGAKTPFEKVSKRKGLPPPPFFT